MTAMTGGTGGTPPPDTGTGAGGGKGARPGSAHAGRPGKPGWGRRLRFLSGASLAAKVVAGSGAALFLGVLVLSLGSIRYQREHLHEELAAGGDRLGTTIRLGARYAMMLNARDEINQIISDVARQKDIVSIRIYNKEGVIKFSGDPGEVERRTNIRDEACAACHRTAEPRKWLALHERTRVFTDEGGRRLLGSLTPIMNEPGCSGEPCHFHPADKLVLGALEVGLSLEAAEAEVLSFQTRVVTLAAAVFLLGATAVHLFLRRFLTRPVARLIEGTRAVARGGTVDLSDVRQQDEIGELAGAITRMARDISGKQAELNRQRDEYQRLFDQVPCAITVQDKNLRLLKYNRMFRENFTPKPGDFCFQAYKGRTGKCPNCAVEMTMQTGLAHCSEESGFHTDGSRAHWIVHTSPVFDAEGRVTAAMEMTLDITDRKELEEKLRRSELKYHAIFNHIPSAVFVLDQQTLEVVDCNSTAEKVYGWPREEMKGRSFLDLFPADERERYASQLKAFTVLNRARNVARDGRPFHVDIMLSPAEYLARQVLLVTTTDITERLEAEQKVIQAGKMATLGEMATGVAHELNQPLTVIKTAGGFLLRKVTRGEPIDPEILATMAREIDGHVDRASRIIGHMRDFGRRSDLALERVDLNAVLQSATEFFSRQLSLRGIDIDWRLAEPLPPVMAVANRLEQVFINLLLNARDAIEERSEKEPGAPRRISVETSADDRRVTVAVCDTGGGIPPALLPRIFEPFFTTKKVGKGTGLGLSISYGLVREFGGSIQASNLPEGGACFTLRFPVTSGTVGAAPRTAGDAGSALSAASGASGASGAPGASEPNGAPGAVADGGGEGDAA
ncbi:PAS domain S-box protein [Nitratidesulfovibrio sp. HK-II]|uniref:PAS domain S-box protein n=1 Tax=Nitratidesulfovibrio sp. HK-II TaxID=2009266 RepID=UPI000E2FE027|nr:PAS domain S-box protein [Nitratidesulfovibrio sp. HK-II]GBO96924.1 sensory box histidine kinase [Nitratidesulfovibrio sp. HK-II]